MTVELPLFDGVAPAPQEAAVRALFEAFSSREVEVALKLMHPDVVFEPMTATVTQGGQPYRGHAGIRRYAEDVQTHWRRLTIQLKQIRSAGRAVVALGLVSGCGEEGSFEDAPTTWMVRFKDGLVAHVQIFSDQRYVTAALTEQGMPGETGTDEGGARFARIPASSSAKGACPPASAAGECGPASIKGGMPAAGECLPAAVGADA